MEKRYEHEIVEKEVQELWEKLDCYAFEKAESSGAAESFGAEGDKEIFSIDTPPPTVSGSLHIGHLFSYTQTDIIARYKRMSGLNVFYPMGFDDNGLPTERFVEKKHKIRGHMLARSEFINLCLKESRETAEVFAKLWRRMGLSVDWSKLYSTISDRSRKISQHSFIELYKSGKMYRKEEPALYCTTCRTTVAQAELDDVESKSSFNDILFGLSDGPALAVATTRPELLPACVALFFNPDDERYKPLEGLQATVPVFNHKVPILADELVDKEKGTGLVMCCTFGDQQDVLWFKKHKLPFVSAVGRDGKWTEGTGPLAGLRVADARKKVLELLEVEEKLLGQKDIVHSVNVHERCKREIEYLVLPQWFVKILDKKEDLLALADEINWKPEFMKHRYKDWVTNLNWDWCVSRQRFYGVPFPVWYCGDCGHTLIAKESDLPVDPQEKVYDGSCDKCSGKNIVPEADVMDTWNTSSLTPQINIDWPNEKAPLVLPMSLRPQAHDIIRTWTFYTIVKAFYHSNTIPWKNIAVSGYVVARAREKISKSKGNAPTDPERLLKTFPADAVRYWAANGRLGVDTQFSEEQFKVGRRLLTKLWNAFRFCKDQINEHEAGSRADNLGPLNEWLLHKFSSVVVGYKKDCDAYEYTLALERVERFFWHVFCDNYLELIKDQIFNPEKYDESVSAGTRQTLYEVCFGLLQLFAPFIPHLTEKLFQLFFASKEGVASLHNTILNSERFACDFGGNAELVDDLVEIVADVRKLKSEKQLSLKTELASVEISSADESALKSLATLENVLKGVAKAKKIEYLVRKHDEAKKFHVSITL